MIKTQISLLRIGNKYFNRESDIIATVNSVDGLKDFQIRQLIKNTIGIEVFNNSKVKNSYLDVTECIEFIAFKTE